MAHQWNPPSEEGVVVPKDSKLIQTRLELPVLRTRPSGLVSRMHKKVRNFCRVYAYNHFRDEDVDDEELADKKLEKFMSPENERGVLYEFLSEGRCERQCRSKSTSLFLLVYPFSYQESRLVLKTRNVM
jgi:hypothetical protein